MQQKLLYDCQLDKQHLNSRGCYGEKGRYSAKLFWGQWWYYYDYTWCSALLYASEKVLWRIQAVLCFIFMFSRAKIFRLQIGLQGLFYYCPWLLNHRTSSRSRQIMRETSSSGFTRLQSLVRAQTDARFKRVSNEYLYTKKRIGARAFHWVSVMRRAMRGDFQPARRL